MKQHGLLHESKQTSTLHATQEFYTLTLVRKAPKHLQVSSLSLSATGSA